MQTLNFTFVRSIDMVLSSSCHGAEFLTTAAALRREPSFGFGELQLLSATEARWTWHKNQDSLAVPSDTVNITRNLQCVNQLTLPL